MGSLFFQPFTGTAQAAESCETPTSAVALACAGHILASAVDSIASAQQLNGASVPPVPGTIIGQSSLLDQVSQTAGRITQAAVDCLTSQSSGCSLRVQTSLLGFVTHAAAQAEQVTSSCVSLPDLMCGAAAAAVTQQAHAVEFLATTCLDGTNDQCRQLAALVGPEVAAFEVLAGQCANSPDSTCGTLTNGLARTLDAAVTCIVGRVGTAASTGASVSAACDAVNATASSSVDQMVSCPACSALLAALVTEVQTVLPDVTTVSGSLDPGDIGLAASPIVFLPIPTIGAALHVPSTGSSAEDGAVEATATQPNMTLHGGSIIQVPHYVVTYWGWGTNNSDEAAFKSKLEGFLGAVGNSAWQHVQTQYYDLAHGPIQNPSGEFGGSWADDKSAVPSEPTFQDVMNEAAHAVTKHFGFQTNTVNIIVTPPNHDAAGSASRNGTYCGYHDAINSADAQAQGAKYIYLPYDSIEGACNDGLATLAGLTIVTGHELTEADTDPDASTGWYDSNGVEGEDGDKCAWGTGPGGNGIPAPKPVPFGSTSYWVQPIWSNSGSYCSFSGPAVYYPTVPVTITSEAYGQGPANSHYVSASCTFSPTGAGSGTISGRLTMSTYAPETGIPTEEPALSESIRCDVTGGGTAGTFVGTSTANADAVTSGSNPDGATGTNQVCVSGVAKAADQTVVTVPKKCVTF